MDEREYSLVEHLRDLRTRLGYGVLGIVIATFGCFAFSDAFILWLKTPMADVLGAEAQFVVLAPHEYFFVKLKIALVAGIFVSSPWLFYQFWLFVAPGLFKHERKYVFSFVFAGAFFFIAGAVFCYFVVFPPMFTFFVGTLPEGIVGTYSVGVLYGFATNMLLAFGLVFEAPVVVFLLAVMGIVDPDNLGKWRRYVIVLAFILAAVITPTPDPLTQSLMAVPMILLYELGLFAARLFIGKKPVAEPISSESTSP